MAKVVLGDSEEEGVGSNRRRSRRLAKSQGRYKQKANRFRVGEEEDVDSKHSERESREVKNPNSKREKEVKDNSP